MKTYPFLAVFICLCVNTAAQEYSFKYGKITPDELRMTLYEPEPDAPAVFIYDDTDIHYSFGNSIQLLCYRTVKIKVFKDEGVKWGDVAIDFGNYQLSKEVVSRIDAAAYNLVDGKTVKTQLKRQNIFEEVLDEHTKRLKFSIPEVRAGTVIEYRYLLTSDFIGQIPDVDVQHAIPVVRSTAQISIPEYFTHHIHTRGYLTLPVKKELENGGAAGFSGFSYTNTKYICNIDRVPSLRKEPYVWHLDDFRAGLEFEINGLEIPGSLYKSFTRTWADVYESLDRSEFGRYADIRNPFKDEVAAIVARNADDERRQLHEILKFVQSRIAWDGTYRLTPESSPHAAVDKGRGDSGSINFILAAAQTGNHPAQSPLRRTASADPRHRPHPHLRIADEAQKRGDGLPRCHRPPLGRQRPAHAAARRPRQALQSGTSFRKLDQPLLAGAERRTVADHGPSDGRGGVGMHRNGH